MADTEEARRAGRRSSPSRPPRRTARPRPVGRGPALTGGPRELARRAAARSGRLGHAQRRPRPRPSSEGTPRGSHRGPLAVVRGGRRLSGGPRAGDASAHRGHRSRTGRVPDHASGRRTPQARAADINAAFADPRIRGILAVVGGEDQITVIPHLDAELARADPKPFLGTSDNTNLHHWLWANGIASFYGGSSQVHLGPGPAVDDIHARSLRAALLTGEELEITDPGESEDVGVDWADPRALESFGEREPTEPWTWHGPARSVTGRTWGGCIEVIEWILTAGRFPFPPQRPGGRGAPRRNLRGTPPGPRGRMDRPVARRARHSRRGRRGAAGPAAGVRLHPAARRPGADPAAHRTTRCGRRA